MVGFGLSLALPSCGSDGECGDEIVSMTEDCDNGRENNILEDYGVEGDCTVECRRAGFCGDGVLQSEFEECDPSLPTSECTPACTLPRCGDAIVSEGEACDLGEENSAEGSCTEECQLPSCGDGFLHMASGEECDAGMNNVSYAMDPAECYVGCTTMGSYCGDGVLDEPQEKCDAGEENVTYSADLSGCFINCTEDDGPYCGDGVVDDPYEDCDFKDKNGTGRGCTSSCGIAARVFVTSQKYTGDLGGIAGADAKCNELASTLNSEHEFRAWLDTNDLPNPPSERFARHDGFYVLPNGTPVAINWGDLTDGELLAPISANEFGLPVDDSDLTVWTRVAADGTHLEVNADCLGWTDGTIGYNGWAGDLGQSNSEWTDTTFLICDVPRRLYCFEQIE